MSDTQPLPVTLANLKRSTRESEAIVNELWERHGQFESDAASRKVTLSDVEGFCLKMNDALEQIAYTAFGAKESQTFPRIHAHALISANRTCMRRAEQVYDFWNRPAEDILVDFERAYVQAEEMRRRFSQAEAAPNLSPTLA